MINRNSILYFSVILIFATFCVVMHAKQLNTYQTIKTSPPKIVKISLQKGDKIKISVFNTNAQFQISLKMDSQKLGIQKEDICFASQVCNLQFDSLWDADGVVIVQVMAYQFSYQIIQNGMELKRETNIVTNFINGKFIYNKLVLPGIYTIRVQYQSVYAPSIVMSLMDTNFTIIANQSNQVNLKIEDSMPFYSFFFTLIPDQEESSEDIIDHFFPVTIEIPNQLLKGCDGTNLYDPKIRACPVEVKTQDSIKINKVGSFPTIKLEEQQKVQIKITIVEFKKWPELFNNQRLAVYIGAGNDPRAFYGLAQHEVLSKFKFKQQCSMSSPSCTFNFILSKGNYTMMPLFPDSQINSFIYLYERFNDNELMQSFYSILPTIFESDKKIYQSSILLEFINHKEKLTEIQMICEDPFLMMQYLILEKSSALDQSNEAFLDFVEGSVDQVFNSDLNKAQIFTSLKPNKAYLLVILMISAQKYQKTIDEKRQDWQDSVDLKMNDNDDVEEPFQEFFYLETSTIELKIMNGKFPYKKLSETQKEEQNINKEEPEKLQIQEKPKDNENLSNKQTTKPKDSSSDNQSQLTKQDNKPFSSTSILIQVLGAIVVILILLVMFYLCIFNRAPAKESDHKQLVTEQPSGSITMPDSAIEISQIIKTESSIERSQSSMMEEQPKIQQKQQQSKAIQQ